MATLLPWARQSFCFVMLEACVTPGYYNSHFNAIFNPSNYQFSLLPIFRICARTSTVSDSSSHLDPLVCRQHFAFRVEATRSASVVAHVVLLLFVEVFLTKARSTLFGGLAQFAVTWRAYPTFCHGKCAKPLLGYACKVTDLLRLLHSTAFIPFYSFCALLLASR